MNYVAALVFMCMQGGCQQHQVMVEPKACLMKPIRVKIPNDGEWKDGRVGIKCTGKENGK